MERDLRQRLSTGEWSSGQALPSVADLAEHYQVARGTVAKALRRLADDDLVNVVAHWGTFKV